MKLQSFHGPENTIDAFCNPIFNLQLRQNFPVDSGNSAGMENMNDLYTEIDISYICRSGTSPRLHQAQQNINWLLAKDGWKIQ